MHRSVGSQRFTRRFPHFGLLAAPLIGGVASLGIGGQVHANIIINPIFDVSITSDPNAAAIEATINQAVNLYQTTITTPITVSIKYASINTGLGQSSTFVGSTTYSTVLGQLQANSSGDASDVSALASIPAGANNPVNGGTTIQLSTANFRALGFNASPPAGSPDSTISINTGLTNITRGVDNDPAKYDLLGVVEHETDEALGLGSALDEGSTTGDIRIEDLFRYSAPGTRSFTTSAAAVSYFSIDGGTTNLVGFNQVGPPGGSDYGDWVSSANFRVQDAFGTPGVIPTFGVEATALDVIGYNFAPVPEPATLGLLAIGGLGLLGRRRRESR